MALFDFILEALGAFDEDVAPAPKKVDAKIDKQDPFGFPTEVDPMANRADTVEILNVSDRSESSRNRLVRYEEFDRMDTSDIAAILDIVTQAVLTFDDVRAAQGFKVEAETDPRAQEIIDLALKRTEFQDKIFEITHDVIKYGDAFVEPIYSGKELVKLVVYDPNEIYRNQDDKGRLAKGKVDGFSTAFQQKRNSRVVAGWEAWEMHHFKFMESDRSAYSKKGLLDDIRSDWRKLQAVELGMVVARVTRAYPRRRIEMDMTDIPTDKQREVTEAIKRNMTRKSFGVRSTTVDGIPQAPVEEDIYSTTGYIKDGNGKLVPRLNSITTEDPNMSGLASLEDVSYLRQKVFSRIPADNVGIKRNTSGDMDSQDLAYARLLRQIQRSLEKTIRKIIEQALKSAGIAEPEFKVVFPAVVVGAAWKHADARFKDSLTVRNFLEMGMIPREFALKRIYGLNDAEVQELFQKILEEQQSEVFQSVFLPLRNGIPNTGGTDGADPISAKPNDLRAADTPATARGKVGKNSLQTFPDRQIDKRRTKSITNSGVPRGTALGKRLRGNFGGGR